MCNQQVLYRMNYLNVIYLAIHEHKTLTHRASLCSISGKMFDSGILGFGWSIYGDHDIDENSFPGTC